jgi:predicted NodU family carbamoyl transferase
MVTNTSFNTAFEPIVSSPEGAISTFLQLGADDLAMGPFLVSRADIERSR